MTHSYEQIMQDALAATRRDALDESDVLLRQALAMNPAAAMPHFLRAANFAHADRHDLAEASYVACLTRAPSLAMARFQLGLLQLTGGRPAVARASWEPLLGLADAHPLKLFARGLLAMLEEDASGACRFIREGIAMNRDNVPLNVDMQALLQRLEHAEAPSAPAGADAAGASPSDAHFLIGAYRRQ